MCTTMNELERVVADYRSLKAMKEELDAQLKDAEREMISYLDNNKWKDELVPERLKCFFTTWAYEYRIGKDQDECESLLKRIYENAEVAGFMDYEEFKEYMLQFVR